MWNPNTKVMKEKNFQPRILYLMRLSFIIEGEMKSFPDKQKLKKSVTGPTGNVERTSLILKEKKWY